MIWWYSPLPHWCPHEINQLCTGEYINTKCIQCSLCILIVIDNDAGTWNISVSNVYYYWTIHPPATPAPEMIVCVGEIKYFSNQNNFSKDSLYCITTKQFCVFFVRLQWMFDYILKSWTNKGELSYNFINITFLFISWTFLSRPFSAAHNQFQSHSGRLPTPLYLSHFIISPLQYLYNKEKVN